MSSSSGSSSSSNPLDVFRTDLVYAVQKNRRTLEKRRNRRFGCLHWGTYKILRVNKTLRVDHETGEWFKLGYLAPQTYNRVINNIPSSLRRLPSFQTIRFVTLISFTV